MMRWDGANALVLHTRDLPSLYLAQPALSLCRYLHTASQFLGGDGSKEALRKLRILFVILY